ncbi:MAG: hypothetical protein HFF39_04205 [Lawsonibacter sp.]|nr:hypothetical protein [Lawsonibacter sp.]
MEGRFELEGGGQLEVREEGARLRLSVRRRLDGAGLYKAWLRGERGEYLLGTLVPQGQFLCLERTVSRDTLSQAGCWPVAGGRTALAFSFGEEGEPPSPDWRWEHRPALRIRDPVLAEAAAAWGSMLLREGNGGFQLAAPLDIHRPFPLTPLFCLARPLRVDGQTHVVFTFNQEGEPRPYAEWKQL